jgi:protein SCO1/2
VVEEREKARSPQPAVLPVYANVTPFSVTNQLGNVVTKESLKGKIWMANIIFTRCPGPCAQMTAQMAELQKAVPKEWPVQFVSLTTDPEFDQPKVMAKYADRFKADSSRWWFVTGTKRDMVDLAVKGLLLTTVDKPEGQRDIPEDLFIHSTISVLVDGQGRIRKTFQALPPDAEENEQKAAAYKQGVIVEMRDAIAQLLKEKPSK